MLQAAGSLAAIAVLAVVGLLMARRGLLDDRAVTALKLLVTRVTLPLLLFRAFLQLEPDGRNAVLAVVVFAACALMGLAGAGAARVLRLPRPETRLLLQGFEAGMLGYALFAALHTTARLPAFAALDMGQVVYVFTVLLVQMKLLEQRRRAAVGGPGADGPGARVDFPWRDVVASPVLWAITAGLVLSLAAPGAARGLADADGLAAPVFDTVGGLTTPLVCLVIGASLAAGVPRDRAIVAIVGLRLVVGLGLGLLVALVVVPALGFSEWHARAALMLFLLPAPFVIPVYHRRNPALVGSVLTLSTAVSVVAVVALTLVGIV